MKLRDAHASGDCRRLQVKEREREREGEGERVRDAVFVNSFLLA